MTQFGRLLRGERERRGWSQARLAEEVGTTPNTISSWERGLMVPSAYFRERLTSLFNRNAVELGLVSESYEEAAPVAEPVGESAAAAPAVPGRAAWSNRQRLLDKVAAFWVRGVLEPSLHTNARISLRLQVMPDAVSSPLADLTPQASKSYLLPAHTSLLQAYDEAVGELLILGEPGAGKTTLLLTLLEDLLKRALNDERHPLPVVFNLASWHKETSSLADWLIDELQRIYKVSLPQSRAWIEGEQILPLLDGLDEVQSTARMSCIEAINAYHQQHGLLPLVVCCRTGDYMLAHKRLALQNAVMVQPLTQADIETYLDRVGIPADFAAQLIEQDSVLQELMNTPLMLNILADAYRNTPSHPLRLEGTLEEQRQQALATYARQMLVRGQKRLRYPTEQSAHWLACLARQIIAQQRADFALDRLQPNALPTCPAIRRLWTFTNQLLYGLIFGLVCSQIFMLVQVDDSSTLGHFWPYTGLGVISGLFFGPASIYFHGERGKYGKWRHSLLAFIIFGGIYSLGIKSPFGFVYGLVGAIIAWIGPLRSPQKGIEPVEIVGWSWRSMGRRMLSYQRNVLIWALIIGAFVGLLSSLGGDVQQGWVNFIAFTLVVALLIGPIISIIGGFSSGTSRAMLPEQKRIRPNEGIWRSARNALMVGIAGALITECTFEVVMLIFSWFVQEVLFRITGPLGAIHLDGTLNDLLLGLVAGLFPALAVGIGAAWNFGGAACLQHLLLRIFLLRCNLLPWRAPQFLDAATESLLLRKVGGQYLFTHRLLLEYFASL